MSAVETKRYPVRSVRSITNVGIRAAITNVKQKESNALSVKS